MKTNDLRYNATKKGVNFHGKEVDIIINIRLNDECKNGHQDFSITGTIYKAGKRGDHNMLTGGAIGDHISKLFPEFEIFNNLHLCDASGVPMYAIENGFYHLKNGFNRTKPNEANFKAEFCSYYRMTPNQFDAIKDSENKLEYGILLKELGILSQWKKEADQAIKILEDLTGNEFVNDSKKSQYNAASIEDINEFIERKKAGYYSAENKEKRAIEETNKKREKRFNDIIEHCKKEVNKEQTERDVKLFLLKRIDSLYNKQLNRDKGFSIDFSFDDFIYYNHLNRVKFNWRKSSFSREMSEFEFKTFCDSLNKKDFDSLPPGISFEHDKEVYMMN